MIIPGSSRVAITQNIRALAHGHMEAKKMGYHLIYDRMPDGSQMKNPEATSHFLWNAVQRRVLSYLLAQQEKSTRGVSAPRVTPTGVRLCGTWEWTPGSRRSLLILGLDGSTITGTEPYGCTITHIGSRRKASGQQLYLSAVAPQALLPPHITAASLWLNGSNDHHGGHERGCETFKNFNPEVPWDFAVQARSSQHRKTRR